jgi:DNA-binding transcriptional regulator LsrR (DeoR family)
MFGKVNVAYIGIGVPSPNGVLYRSSIINSREIADLQQQGAVGDIALRFFNAEGQPIHSDLDERVIGISLQQLKQCDRVVGVAGGASKRDVVYAVLKSKLINILITDHLLAAALLETQPNSAAPFIRE